MEIKSVGVLGCGLMGSGIAQVCAAAGYKTVVREIEQSLLDKGLNQINKFLSDGVEKGKITAEAKQRTLANLSGTTTFEDLQGCDIVIEAIVENVDQKTAAFAALDATVGDQTVFCSNTSSLCITELAAKTRRPDRFAGLHFFNPVPLMKLVEVIRGLTTSDDTYRTVYAFANRWARSRSRLRTTPASSSIGSSYRTCWTRFVRTSTASARSRTSTRA
jgi:3-hydroxybutyryl-CoA dehydrogenase